ncbi:Uncharacterized conserved protein YlxW, UPF0749 family [Natronincola peptidivorans]|uniref:Uncharacterized conserved protein YlxW, UPF0749 family n=1 Tax=Natronincola peptidivorans TaxID=426128 RepID=A0A1I0D6U5_9FIRM|nr:Uncharacterized conserved protein YlxW, UPF0749 family [Natronincola peptidivorans]
MKRYFVLIKGSETLKKPHFSIIAFVAFTIFGTIIGIHIDVLGEINEEFPLPFSGDTEVQEVLDLRKANQDMKTRIEELRTEINNYEEERATENIVLKNLKTKVNENRMLAGHEAAIGPGIKITLESTLEENIAIIVQQKKYLINLINELRMSGAEVIAVNNHRITARTEVTLAGIHINVNTMPIAPPYTIKAIGNMDGFRRYVNFRTLLFDLMQGDGIHATIEFEEEMKIPALTKEKPIQFFDITGNGN